MMGERGASRTSPPTERLKNGVGEGLAPPEKTKTLIKKRGVEDVAPYNDGGTDRTLGYEADSRGRLSLQE